MAPKRTTRSKQGLAQPTLSFQTRKAGLAGTSKTSKNASLSSVPSRSDISIPIPPSEDEAAPKTDDLSTQRKTDGEAVVERPSPHGALASANAEQAELESGKKRKRQELNVRDKNWEGVKKEAEGLMGGMKPIHAGPDTHNDVHHILRVFDMTSSYGPCVGVTRLQRWERAQKWGLNPPVEIKMILTTRQGEDEVDYRENVLHPWLG